MIRDTLAHHFRIGTFIFDTNLDGITHEESVRAPRPAGNTLNWVVGHIVRTRNQVLELMGDRPIYDDEDFLGYGADRPADAPVLELDELKRRFHELDARLDAAVASLPDDEELEKPAPFSPTGNPHETTGSLLQSIAFHEAYHLGQTGILRRLLGKPGALLAPGEEGHGEEGHGE